MNKTHVKTGNDINVISGKWKGEDAKIIAVLKAKNRVVLEMTGLSPEKKKQIGVKTVKKSQENPQGGLVARTVSVHISNVKLVNAKSDKDKK